METEIVYGVDCVVANPISPITSGPSLFVVTAVQGDGFCVRSVISDQFVHHSPLVVAFLQLIFCGG